MKHASHHHCMMTTDCPVCDAQSSVSTQTGKGTPEHFGIHFMLDGYMGDPARLNDADLMATLLNELPQKLGMKILGTPVVHDVQPISEKDQGGKTGFVVVTESHISIHTFPWQGFVTADVYTCKSTMDTDLVLRTLVDAFGLQKTELNTVLRGREFAKYTRQAADGTHRK